MDCFINHNSKIEYNCQLIPEKVLNFYLKCSNGNWELDNVIRMIEADVECGAAEQQLGCTTSNSHFKLVFKWSGVTNPCSLLVEGGRSSILNIELAGWKGVITGASQIHISPALRLWSLWSH